MSKGGSEPAALHHKPSTKSKPFFTPGLNYSTNGFQLYWGEHILELVNTVKPSHNKALCLEVGVGDARFKQPIQARGFQFVGLDVVHSSSIDILGDAHALPFANEAFDLAIMNQVMEHLIHPWGALQELNRVLRKGGHFIGSVAFLEPFHDSYFHFSHWGVEQILRDSGFEPLEINPGINMIPLLALTLADPGPSRLATRVAGALTGAMMKMRYLVGGAFIRSRFGKASQEFATYKETPKRDPFKFAGHIYFAARKRENP